MKSKLTLIRMGRVACLAAGLALVVGSTGCSWFKKGDKAQKGDMTAATDYKAQGSDKPLPTPTSQPTDAPRPVGLREATPLMVIYFDYDQADIRDDQMQRCEQNLKYLQDHPDAKVLIEGHGDERGTTEYNFALGDRRARSIMNYFSKGGIAADRIQILSKGEEEPVSPGHDEADWVLNRRCTFKFFD